MRYHLHIQNPKPPKVETLSKFKVDKYIFEASVTEAQARQSRRDRESGNDRQLGIIYVQTINTSLELLHVFFTRVYSSTLLST